MDEKDIYKDKELKFNTVLRFAIILFCHKAKITLPWHMIATYLGRA